MHRAEHLTCKARQEGTTPAFHCMDRIIIIGPISAMMPAGRVEGFFDLGQPLEGLLLFGRDHGCGGDETGDGRAGQGGPRRRLNPGAWIDTLREVMLQVADDARDRLPRLGRLPGEKLALTGWGLRGWRRGV